MLDISPKKTCVSFYLKSVGGRQKI